MEFLLQLQTLDAPEETKDVEASILSLSTASPIVCTASTYSMSIC